MLDCVVIEVDDIQRSVRAGCREYRSEPGIGRRHELTALIRSTGGERSSGGLEDVAVDQVVNGLAGEGIVLEIPRKIATCVDREAACRGEASRLRVVYHKRILSDGKNRGLRLMVGNR